jgi:hypothetical protein
MVVGAVRLGRGTPANLVFSYRVRSSKEVNWLFQRNTLFLEDYLRADVPAVESGARQAVLALVSEQPGIPLSELFRMTQAVGGAG